MVTPHMHGCAPTIRPLTILVLVVTATALANLEVGLVNVALPTLAATFGVGPTTVQWVAIAYQLAIVGTLVLFGRLVDLHGGRPLYVTGMAIIALASTLAALSQSALWLILARGLLGLGAAMLLATGQALLALAYPADGRGRAFGIMHMAVAIGLMSGPALGGLLITTVGWRMIFLAPLPLALGAGAWAWKVLPAQPPRRHESLDVAGAVLICATAILLVVGLTGVASLTWAAASAALLLALVAGSAFLVVERRHVAPLVDLHLLRQWPLSAGLLAALLTFIALASNMFLVPFALQDLLGHSPAVAGLVMMAVPLAILPVAPLAGVVADRWGSRVPTTVGLGAITASIIAMARFQATTKLSVAVAVLALYGVGAGLFQAPNNSAILGAAPPERTGSVSAMLALARNLGQVIGVAIASTVWMWRRTNATAGPVASAAHAVSAGLRDAFLVLAAFGLLALIVTALRPEMKGEKDDA